ncbi:hypothetical protein HPB48_013159 [Haemaphysalis longicornis]|uniref:Uncharacterized protein n=1 Tax=Haemaphysalis longicornis TaxID=44386 RepID=A0A9J6GYK7_HAELO|nr:hypothetical protein HPB48_013159 [Haemaphysalis longicornis]
MLIGHASTGTLNGLLGQFTGHRRYFATALAPAVVYHALEMHIFKKTGPQSWSRVTGPEGAFVSTDYPTSRSEDGSDLRSQGKKGKYLLENFARPMKDPILVNENTGRRYLALEYAGHLLSMAFLEISADGLKFHTPE